MSYVKSKKNLDIAILSGRSEQHLVEFTGLRVHAAVVQPLVALVDDAAKAGFDLAVASAFRSFERQCVIWNEKATGRRQLLAADESILDSSRLSPEELMFAILRWSALPGFSRHHWGTDIDVYDRSAIPEGYRLRLTLEETVGGGPLAPFHLWLDDYLKSHDGFFRPYTRPWGGISPEPWHLSYGPVAAEFQQAQDPQILKALIASIDIALKDAILRHFDEIFERFVWIPWELYPSSCRPPC